MKDIKQIAQELRLNVTEPGSPIYIAPGKEQYFPLHKNIIAAFRKIKHAMIIYTFEHKAMTPAQIDADVETLLEEACVLLRKEIRNTFCLFCQGGEDCADCDKQVEAVLCALISELPQIQKLILSDVTASYNGDPAASDPYQILLCYPGLRAMCYQRVAHFLYKQRVQLIPRIITEYAHSKTGIDIHPGAQIGEGFFIDHGTGVVIGETAVIGKNVKIYQGVTLGAKSFPLGDNGHPVKGIKRHPNIEDDVTIYANATVLGDITVGRGNIIGANSWVTKDMPAKI